jgi:hypothetical protein
MLMGTQMRKLVWEFAIKIEEAESEALRLLGPPG